MTTISTLANQLIAVDQFIASYAEKYSTRSIYNAKEFRLEKLRQLCCIMDIHRAPMDRAEHTTKTIATMRAWVLPYPVGIESEYKDEYGEPVDQANTLREAIVKDISFLLVATANSDFNMPPYLVPGQRKLYILAVQGKLANRVKVYAKAKARFQFATPLGDRDTPEKMEQEIDEAVATLDARKDELLKLKKEFAGKLKATYAEPKFEGTNWLDERRKTIRKK